MRLQTIAPLMALLIASSVSAQVQRPLPTAAPVQGATQVQGGTIEEVVRDTSGTVLSGVTVEARAANGAVLRTETDAAGVYRFADVPRGNYIVTATRQGFGLGKNDNARARRGRVTKIDFNLAPVVETIA